MKGNYTDIILISAIIIVVFLVPLRFLYKKWFADNDCARWATNALIICAIGLLYAGNKYMLPFVGNDEIYVSHNGYYIHDNNCTIDSKWFTEKYNKYDVLMMRNQELCDCCLQYELEKMTIIHMINMYELYRQLSLAEIKNNYMRKYKYVDYKVYKSLVKLYNNKRLLHDDYDDE